MNSEAIHLQGYAHALADVCRRGYAGLVADILTAGKVTLEDLQAARVDASDLEELRAAISPGRRVKR